MADISRQDVQSLLDTTRNILLQRLVTRQEVQAITEGARDRIVANMQQQAQLVRQMNYQNIQMYRRVVALETRMANLEHELKASRQLTLHVAENMPQKIIMPVMPENKAQAPTPTQQYAYRPN
jgi:hypothetical protein